MQRQIDSFFFIISFLICATLLTPWPGFAEKRQHKGQQSQFSTSEDLKGYVDFWRLIFTKYGKNHLVFHHRKYPFIVYSVLDFSEYAGGSPKKFDVIKERASVTETNRIQNALRNLGEGNKPSTPFERRLQTLFHSLGVGKDRYLEAIEPGQIRSQTGIRERFRDGIRRSGRYLHAIEKIFREEGVPTEISRLPLVESAFDDSAYSSAGAAGIWQFMRFTGKQYMTINAAIDERRDPFISSRAAAQYLAHAYEVLGSWPLAITSYNHGINGTLNAAKTTGSRDLSSIIKHYNGSGFGFASSNFFAEFLAALDVEKHYQIYFPGLVKDSPWQYNEMRLTRAENYRNLLRLTKSNHEEFLKLNPALLKPVLRGSAKIPSGFLVKVPLGEGQVIKAIVKHGSVSPAQESPAVKKISLKEISPAQAPPESTKFSSQVSNQVGEKQTSSNTKRRTYTVQSGDSLWSISREMRVPTTQLKRINEKAQGKIKPGQVLYLE